ncbi:MAG: nitroreductase family protein [Deltaproteobacteria bacterium]|nr:nitroreductase family protein [Deltaproteobacteria bacterium]
MDFNDVINQRRAINHFDPNEPVSDELIKQVVELAAKAPSSFNLQPWSLMILRDLEEKKRLRKLAWDQPKVTEAPVVFIFLADRDGWKKGHPFVEKNFQEMVRAGSMVPEKYEWFTKVIAGLYGTDDEKSQAFACKNTGFYAMAVMFAAKSLGLETHPMDGFDHDAVRREFHIPDNYWIPLLMAVGYMDRTKTLHPPNWRKTFDEIVVKFT